MMKAWAINKINSESISIDLPSESLIKIEIPIPVIKNSNEVLVKIKSSSLNFNSVWSCLRQPMDPFALLAGHIKRNPNDQHHNLNYFIPGSDGAGVIVDIGDNVKDFAIGDEVVIHCAVISDDDNNLKDPMLSKSQSIWGYETNYGAFAEYTLVKSSQLIKKPAKIDFLTAGSCILTLGTAYRMLLSENGARIKKNETCLIWGASGGLGIFAIQLCLSIGAIPVCVVSSEEKREFCINLGAKNIIVLDEKEQENLIDLNGKPNYYMWRKFEKKLIESIGNNRVDCVFEHVGRNVFSMSIFFLRRGGRLVTCAATSGFEATIDIRYVWMEMKTIIGSHFCTPSEANDAFDMLVQGHISHNYQNILTFDEIPTGLDLLYSRNSKGKIVVQY